MSLKIRVPDPQLTASQVGVGSVVGGDLGGSLPDPDVTGIQGTPVSSTPPVDLQRPQYIAADALIEWTNDVANQAASPVAASGAAQTLDLATGGMFQVTLTASCTYTFVNIPATGYSSWVLWELEDGTGGHGHTWPAAVTFPGGEPTRDTAAGTLAEYVFETRDAGATIIAHLIGSSPPSSGGITPYHIPTGVTFTVPVDLQSLFADTIVIDAGGSLVVNGRLIGVT